MSGGRTMRVDLANGSRFDMETPSSLHIFARRVSHGATVSNSTHASPWKRSDGKSLHETAEHDATVLSCPPAHGGRAPGGMAPELQRSAPACWGAGDRLAGHDCARLVRPRRDPAPDHPLCLPLRPARWARSALAGGAHGPQPRRLVDRESRWPDVYLHAASASHLP